MTIWVPYYTAESGDRFFGVGHFESRRACLEFAEHMANKPCLQIADYSAAKFVLEPESNHVVAWPSTGSLIGELVGGRDE